MAVYMKPKSETEGLFIAAQNQCLKSKYCGHKSLKDGTDPLCRVGTEQPETVDLFVSCCRQLAKTVCTQRHNEIASYIHCGIYKH